MRSTLVRRIGRVAVGATAAASLLLVPAAQAQVTAPPSVVSIGGATNSTISGVTLNGVTTTLTEAAPGSTVAVHALLTLGSGVNPSWIYWAGFGWAGAASPAGCTVGTAGAGATDPANFNLTAPMIAGVYDVVAALGPDPCPWSSAATGPVVARVVVADYPSLCALVQASSSDPAVANGLCDKLAAAESAAMRGQTKTRDNILRAFTNQLEAQRGKALTGDQADRILLLLGEI